MTGPWEQYQAPATAGPWSKFAEPAAPAATTAEALTPRDKPGFIENLIAPAKGAWNALTTDAGRYSDAVKAGMNGPTGVQDVIPGVNAKDRALGSVAGDLFNLATSPFSGPVNALVVQPGADVLGKVLPAPYLDPKNGFKPMTPEQQRAKNEEIISTALLGLGPKGVRGGAVSEAMTTRYAAKVANTVAKAPREVVLDDAGALTDEGKELAAHHGVHPEDLKAAYDAVAKADEAPAPAAKPAPAPEEPAAPPPADAEPVQAAPIAEPTGSLEAPPSEAPGAANDAGSAPVEEPLAPSAQERLALAQSEGIDLTRGQATQDFVTQEKEQTLQSQPSAEGNAARQFYAQQQEQIGAAVDRFKQAFGNPEAAASERGQLVKDALTEMRDKGKAGVTALYKQARDLAEGLGHNAQNLIHLDTERLLGRLRELFTDEAVPDQVRRSLKQQAAKYGLIGDSPKTIEGETTVSLRDNTGEPAGKVTFTGPPQRLTILNAEDLRQKVNQLYEADTSKQTQSLKPLIDDAVQGAVERAAREGTGDVGQAFTDARAGHIQQQKTFKAKDVVQKLIDWKRGTNTPVVLPEHAIKTIFAGGKEAVTELKKVKAVLLSKPTETSKAAWQAIQAHAVADIFEKAFVINSNAGGGQLGAISGAKLNTAIARFGVDKLKVLLPEADFNQLMKLRRIIGDATIPIRGTTNPSGTAAKVIQFLAQQGAKLAGTVAGHIPVVRELGHGAAYFVRMGKEAAETKKTLEGIREFGTEAAAKVDNPPEPADYAQRFIKVAGSDEVMAPLIASAANEQHR